MQTITLNATRRELTGKQVKQLRNQGQLPAVIYGNGLESQAICVAQTDYDKVFRQAGTSTLVDLVVEGAKPVKVLLHEPQVHPAKPLTLHADFYAVKMSEKLQTEIPLHFVGESEAVETLGGTLNVPIDAVEVECYPDKLVSAIEVDLTSLKTFEDVLRISDIQAPEGIAILNDPEEAVATVVAPRSEEELAALEEGPKTDEEAVANVEVAGEKKDEA